MKVDLHLGKVEGLPEEYLKIVPVYVSGKIDNPAIETIAGWQIAIEGRYTGYGNSIRAFRTPGARVYLSLNNTDEWSVEPAPFKTREDAEACLAMLEINYVETPEPFKPCDWRTWGEQGTS